MFRYFKSGLKHLKKLISKEVHKGEKTLKTEDSKQRTLNDLRKRQKQVETSRVNQVKKSMEAKKAKRKHQHRHRSTPGEIDTREATPSYTHKEGSRWIKNSTLKTKNANKVFTKHQSKR